VSQKAARRALRILKATTKKTKMKKLHIKTIRIDGGTQSRVSIDNELVQEYAQSIDDGAEFPPVVVFNDGVDNWLADGFHRFHAHGMASRTSILADVRAGSKDDALWYSVSDECNGAHGQRLSNADKRKKVLTALEHPKSSNLSDNAIAKHVGVSHTFVQTMRSSLATVASEELENGRTYTTKHGTQAVMKTRNIGKIPSVARIKELEKEEWKRVQAEDKQARDDSAAQPSKQAAKPESDSESEAPTDYTPMDAAQDLISDLQSELVVARMGDIPQELKTQAAEHIAALAADLKTANAMIAALTISRDTYMLENTSMKKQMKAQREEIARLKSGK